MIFLVLLTYFKNKGFYMLLLKRLLRAMPKKHKINLLNRRGAIELTYVYVGSKK